jgi:hypothetical protein
MITRTFIAPVKGRRALLALAGAALAGSTMTSVDAASKAGKKAKQKARARCRQQVAQCEAAILERCADGGDDCADFAIPCCASLATCDVIATLECMFLTQRP